MGISHRVQRGLEHLSRGEYDDAFIQLAIAVDATGRRKYSARTGDRFRLFVRSNERFLTHVATAGAIRLPKDAEVRVASGEIGDLAVALYKARNASIHEADASGVAKFSSGHVLGGGSSFVISEPLLLAVALAVIGDSANKTERLKKDYSFSYGRFENVRYNDLWGKIEKIWTIVQFQP